MKPVSGDLPALDFASARRRLGQLARSAFPEWTDHTMAGFGNTLLDLMAFVSDTLSYYAECQGRECRLTTATQRENVVALARMLGYKAHGATAARAKVVFRLRKPHDTDIVIPTGMLVSTEKITSPKRYQLREDVRIAAGATSATGEAEASTGQLQVVDLRGLPDQAVTLMFAPYLEGSLVVTDSDGAVFHEVDTFIDSKGADRHYVVTVAAQGRATLRFGNGVLGAAPVGRIDIRYKTGGGVADLVEADALTVLERPVLDARGRPVPMTVTNPAPSAGGADAESTASIVARAPQSLRVAQRSITREDFEINARRLPGVARALMLTSDDDQRIPENTGRMYVVPVTGGELTEELRAQ
ncbi:MAG TPA: baseplate J/gp47 family protein, partial [Myxococcota bacterium]|nr:baseplate J/gp47 family protein [Myxococcota bacterium]